MVFTVLLFVIDSEQNPAPDQTELEVNRSRPLVSGEELLSAPADRGGIVALPSQAFCLLPP